MNRNILAYSFFVFFIGLIAVGCGGGGGGGSANPVAAPVSTGSVANLSGVVSLENVPLANAKVFLYPSASAYMAGIAQLGSVRTSILEQTLNNDGSYSTYTDALGKYSFTNIPVGNYTLIAARDQNHQFARTNVILGAVTQLDAQLTPTGSVTGRIQILVENITENVSGAIVYLDGTSYVAVSGLDGTFTIANVPANQSFNLKVISSRGIPTTSPAVSITPGSSFNAGTVLLAAPDVVTSTLSGQVEIAGVAAPDAALAGHMVLLTSENQAPLINLTDENGNFAFIVRAGGAYRVTPIPEEYDSVPFYQNINIVLGENAALSQTFVLQADPVGQVHFMVDGSVTKNGKAFDEADEGGVPLTLTETSTGKTYAAITTADGSFNFEVPTGEYELAVGGGYTFETPLAQNPFPVAAPLTVPAFNIVPTKNVIMVQGSIFKNSKILGETDEAGVALMLTSIDAVTYPSVTDADGNFTFFVPAGDYNLSIGGAYQFVNHPFAGSPLTVPVNAAQQAILAAAIEVTPLYVEQQIVSVRGYVQDAGTNTIAGVNLTLTDTLDPARVFTAISNAAGDFSFEVRPGNYELNVVGQYQPAAALAAFNTDPSGLHELGPITVVSTNVQMAKVQGQISKIAKAFGESDEGGVTLTLTTTDATAETYSAVSAPDGSFHFLVPIGQYSFAVSGSYQFVSDPLSGSPLDVVADYYFATIEVSPTQQKLVQVQGNVAKQAYAFDEIGDHSGVSLTLSATDASGNVFSAISDVNGYFSFNIPSGTYELTVGGNYKLQSPPHPDVVTNDPVTIISAPILVIPSADVYNVIGIISKTLTIPSDPSGTNPITVILRSADNSYETITSNNGDFAFKVKAGTYNIELNGPYVFDSVPVARVINADENYGTLNVSPSTQLTAVLAGTIMLPVPYAVVGDPVEVRLWDEDNSKYVAQKVTVKIPGGYSYRFDSIPPGNYRVLSFPDKNGFFAETPVGSPVGLLPGDSLLNHDLTAVKKRPILASVTLAAGNIIDLLGSDFTEAPINAANTTVLANGKLLPRPLASDLTPTTDRADVSSLNPGEYEIQVSRTWVYPLPGGLTESFKLITPPFLWTKPIQSPTGLVQAELTDTRVKYTWNNAPGTQSSQVRILAGATEIVNVETTENFFEYNSLTPVTLYTIEVVNKAENVVSAPVSDSFTTKTTASTQIQQITLAGSSSYASNGMIDFAAGGGDFFFAYGSSSMLNIAKYNANGVFQMISPMIGAAMASNDHVSLVYDSVNSALYISYFNGTGIVIEAYDPADLTLSTSDSTNILGDKAKLVCSNGKLFVATSEGSTCRLYVYSAPNLTALGTPTLVETFTTSAFPIGVAGYFASICADESKGSLYFICPATQSVANDSYEIREYSLVSPASPGSLVAIIPSNQSPESDFAVRQFAVGGGKIYLRTFATASLPNEYMYFIDQATGLVSQKVFGSTAIANFAKLGDFAVDSKGRIWMGESSNRFVQMNFTGIIFQDLSVNSFVSETSDQIISCDFPDPANFIKIDPANNNMNMMFLTSSLGDLAVYRYTTDY